MTSKRFCSSVFNVLVLVFLVKVSSLLVFMNILHCNCTCIYFITDIDMLVNIKDY